MVLMAVTCVVAIVMALALRVEIAFFFGGQRVLDVGSAAALDPGTLENNTYVHVSGNPMLSRAARYERALTGESFTVFPLAGQRAIYVHASGDALETLTTEYTGRLVTFRAMGARLEGVRVQLAQQGQPVSADAYVLLVGESPTGTWWAVAFALFAGLILLMNGALSVRWFRPLPVQAGDERR